MKKINRQVLLLLKALFLLVIVRQLSFAEGEIYRGKSGSFEIFGTGWPTYDVQVFFIDPTTQTFYNFTLGSNSSGQFSGFTAQGASVSGTVSETTITGTFSGGLTGSFTLNRTPYYGPYQSIQGFYTDTIYQGSTAVSTVFLGTNEGDVFYFASGGSIGVLSVGKIDASGNLSLKSGSSIITGNLKKEDGFLTGSVSIPGKGTFSTELDPVKFSALLNVSTRGFVGTGDNVMIAGFVVADGTKSVLIRVLGSSLTRSGVSGVLADPSVEIYDSTGKLVATNDDWATASAVNKITVASGRANMDPKEAGLILTLFPGAYTAVVRGVGNTTGVAIVEAYDVR